MVFLKFYSCKSIKKSSRCKETINWYFSKI